MLQRLSFGAGLLVVGLALSACGDDGKVSDLSFAPMRIAMDKGEAAFRDYVKSVAGTKVKWSGRVTLVEKTHEDDYVPVAKLYIDADDTQTVPPMADIVFKISLDDMEKYKPAQMVTFTAVIREVVDYAGKPLLRVELKSMN